MLCYQLNPNLSLYFLGNEIVWFISLNFIFSHLYNTFFLKKLRSEKDHHLPNIRKKTNKCLLFKTQCTKPSNNRLTLISSLILWNRLNPVGNQHKIIMKNKFMNENRYSHENDSWRCSIVPIDLLRNRINFFLLQIILLIIRIKIRQKFPWSRKYFWICFILSFVI